MSDQHPNAGVAARTADKNMNGKRPAPPIKIPPEEAPCLTLHGAGNGYVGRLVVPGGFIEMVNGPPGTALTTTTQKIVFILDRSGSMGQNVRRMASIVIPSVARQYFGLSSEDEYTLITFDSTVDTITKTVIKFERTNMNSRGSTQMAGVFDALVNAVIPGTQSTQHIQIVAISDGEVWDTNPTLNAANRAANVLKQSYCISASAIRLFTSGSQPDTRALASILQLNTESPGSIVDVQASSDHGGLMKIVEAIGSTVEGSARPTLLLETTPNCLLASPWAEEATKDIRLNAPKDNKPSTVWFTSIPERVMLNGAEVNILRGEPVTHDTLSLLLEDKINYYIDQLRILKVLNSPSAKDEINRIVSYFQNLEESLPPPSDLSPLLADCSLKGRAKYMKASLSRRLKSITNIMASLAKDELVSTLNLAQQADYLRQTGTGNSRCPRALARRADKAGMDDFAGTIKAEILAMKAHMQKLDGIDDSNHTVSFYSQASTLDGIKCLVEMADDIDVFEQVSAADLLRLFNVVGIPAVGPIGDFPDPMTYRVEKFLYCGVYVSVADITMALHQGGKLTAPGMKDQPEIITEVEKHW